MTRKLRLHIKKNLVFLFLFTLFVSTTIKFNSFALTEPGAFFNDVSYRLIDIDSDSYNDTVIVEFDVNLLNNDSAEVTVELKLYTDEDVLWLSKSKTYTATNATDYQSFEVGPFQEEDDFYFILYLNDGVNDSSDQFTSETFHLYPAIEPMYPDASFALVIENLNDTNNDGVYDSLGLIVDVDLSLEETAEVTVKAELYDDSDLLIMDSNITYETFGTDFDAYYLELGPVPTFGTYYAKLLVFDGHEDPSDTYITDTYTLYPVLDVNASFADVYCEQEDLDADGNNDSLTVFFDVNTEVPWNISMEVIATLYDSNNRVVDRSILQFNSSLDTVDYQSLAFDIVSFSDNYTVELTLNDHTNDPSDVFSLSDIELYAPTNKITKQWTILIYMDGDNNLENAAIDDLNEIEMGGGSNRDINIVALVDRTNYDYVPEDIYSDWTEAKYIKLIRGLNDTIIESPVLLNASEINMGEPQTLHEFATWGLETYPAQHTALIIWDHGGGLDGVCIDEDNGEDLLTIQELQEALSGIYFDFIGFDACLMNAIEVLYELRNNANYIGASFLTEPEDGYPYDAIIEGLHSNSSLTPEDFGILVANSYVEAYDDELYGEVTYSVINTSRLDAVIQKLNEFVNASVGKIHSYFTEIYYSIANSIGYLPMIYADLQTMLYTIISEYNYLPFTGQALDVYIEIEQATIIAKDNSISSKPNGLWIFMPLLPYSYFPDFYNHYDQAIVNSYTNPYSGLDFVKACNWNSFVNEWMVQSTNIFQELELEKEYTATLSEGQGIFLFVDLPKANYTDQFEVKLTMESSVDFDLLVWNELYWIDSELGFADSSTNEGNEPEIIYVSPLQDGRFFIFVSAYSGYGTFSLKIHNTHETVTPTSTNTNTTPPHTTTPTDKGAYPATAFLTLLIVVPILLKKRKQ